MPAENDRRTIAKDLENVVADLKQLAAEAQKRFRQDPADKNFETEYRTKAATRISRYKAALAQAPALFKWSSDEVTRHSLKLRENLKALVFPGNEPASQVYKEGLDRL